MLGAPFGCKLSRGEMQGLGPARWQPSHTTHVETLVSCCFQRASGSPPSGAVSSGTSKASRNGERNSGLAKRNGMRRRRRSGRGGWRGAPSSPAVGAQSWFWGSAPYPRQGCVATEAVDNPRWLARGLPGVPGLCPLGPGRLESLVGSEWLATIACLFVVRLTQRPWGFLFFVPPGPPRSRCSAGAKEKFQLYW